MQKKINMLLSPLHPKSPYSSQRYHYQSIKSHITSHIRSKLPSPIHVQVTITNTLPSPISYSMTVREIIRKCCQRHKWPQRFGHYSIKEMEGTFDVMFGIESLFQRSKNHMGYHVYLTGFFHTFMYKYCLGDLHTLLSLPYLICGWQQGCLASIKWWLYNNLL